MTGPGDDGPAAADRVVVLGIGAALSFGTLAQGAYYAAGLRPFLLLVAVAAAVAAVTAAFRRRRPGAAVLPAACWFAFALWALAVAALRGDVLDGVPHAAVAACLGAVVLAVAGLPAGSRHVLQLVVVGLGTLVAASAWVGVAFRLPPLALPGSDLWRGAATLTYANAAAAYLTIALVVAFAVLPPRRTTTWVLAVLLLGMLSTMSRAGALALLAGAVVYLLLALPGRVRGASTAAGPTDRARLRSALPAVPAAAVAGLGLLPSVPAGAPAQPLVALAAVGVAALVAAQRLTRAYGVAAAAAVVAGVLAALAVRDALAGILATRLSATSAERGDLTRVTVEQWWSAPVVGVGPGRLDLRYVDFTGAPVRAVYTHNEFLQTAAETGAVGLVFVVAGLLTLVAVARGAAAVAMIAAFAVHSAFDYLWHVPVIPLLLVVSVTTFSFVREEVRIPTG